MMPPEPGRIAPDHPTVVRDGAHPRPAARKPIAHQSRDAFARSAEPLREGSLRDRQGNRGEAPLPPATLMGPPARQGHGTGWRTRRPRRVIRRLGVFVETGGGLREEPD